jgi:hypothetical protein
VATIVETRTATLSVETDTDTADPGDSLMATSRARGSSPRAANRSVACGLDVILSGAATAERGSSRGDDEHYCRGEDEIGRENGPGLMVRSQEEPQLSRLRRSD